MKKTYIEKNIANLPDSWIHEKGEYRLHPRIQAINLPVLGMDYEDALVELFIPYIVTEDCHGNSQLQYWDPENDHFRHVTLPLYASVAGGYMYCSKSYTGNVVTEETVKAAEALREAIDTKHFQITMAKQKAKEQAEIAEQIERINQLLKDKDAIGFYNNSHYFKVYEVVSDDFILLPVCKIVYRDKYDEYGCFKASSTIETGWYAAIKKSKIVPNAEIKLSVPVGKEGIFIGKGGRIVKEWCNQLDLRKINVVGI